MSHILDQAEEFRMKAIELLLSERAAIDEMLRKLTHDGAGETAPASDKPRKKSCTKCGEAGHSARNCPTQAPTTERDPTSRMTA